jgi:hypothetical protein
MAKVAKGEQEFGFGMYVGEENETSCPALINGLVGVEAQVSISPQVQTGPATLQCVGVPKFGPMPGATVAAGKCSFIVHQLFSLRIPITLSAMAQATPRHTLCEVPEGAYGLSKEERGDE